MSGDSVSSLLHYGLLDESELAPAYATPAVALSLLLPISGLVLGGLVFLVSIQLSAELELSNHRLAIVALWFALYVAMTGVREHVRMISERPDFRRVNMARVIQHLLFVALAFVSGVFIRVVSDMLTGGPRVGRIMVLDFVMPTAAIVLVSCALHEVNIFREHSDDLLRAFERSKGCGTTTTAAGSNQQ